MIRPGFNPRWSETTILYWCLSLNSLTLEVTHWLTLASRQGYKQMTVHLSPKRTKDFSDIISYLLITGEVNKWKNKLGVALLLKEEVSIDQDIPLMTLRSRECHKAPLNIA